jgi:serine/threonine-protein phosphatase 6 regulatory ankyrin repeat subunit B
MTDYNENLNMLRRAMGQGDYETSVQYYNAINENHSFYTRGASLLMTASGVGNTDIIRTIIDHGADINARDNDGDTALFYALTKQQTAAMELLITRGANVNTKGQSGNNLLHIAVVMNDYKSALLLLRAGAEVDLANDKGETPLMQAVAVGIDDLARLFIEYGADIDAKDDDGDSVLFYAASQGQAKTVKMLIEHGAKVNSVNNAGGAALMTAANRYFRDVVELLLEHGADARICDNEGHGAMYFTAHSSCSLVPDAEIVMLLLRNGADVNDLYDSGCALAFWNDSNSGVGQTVIRRRDFNRGDFLYTDDLFTIRLYPTMPGFEEIFK